MEERNKLIELFGKKFGEIVADEINKYESSNKRANESNYSEDVKNLKTIIEKAVDDICRYIGPDTALILERLDTIIEKLGVIAANTSPYTLKPWTTGPQTYPYTPNPLDPMGPVISYGYNDDRVNMTTTAGDKSFPVADTYKSSTAGDKSLPVTHTYTSLTAEDIDDVLFSMFGQ